MKLNIVEKALLAQSKGWYKFSHFILAAFCIEIPKEVIIKNIGGEDTVRLVHRAPGLVIHPKTTIGCRVQLYQNVTIGKSKPWDGNMKEGGCEIMDDAIICAGAKILFKEEKLIVGKGTVIGANAVLTQSTGEYEIWAGIPARKIGMRTNNEACQSSKHKIYI